MKIGYAILIILLLACAIIIFQSPTHSHNKRSASTGTNQIISPNHSHNKRSASTNQINFSLTFHHDYNVTNATEKFRVFSGVPRYESVLVNDDNFSNAVWQPYDGTVYMNLGPTDGVYHVWLGLKGDGTDAEPVWMGTDATLKRTVPKIFITNPTTNVVATPYVQLQGHSTLPLASVTFDVSNAVSFITNQTGFITEHSVDIRTTSYTTDYFQCYDIPLTNGENVITLHCTDPAGNVTVTNLNVTLDYSTGSNPVIHLEWPKDGMELSCSNFTVRGWTDDASASVTAQITDTNGNTTVVNGIVERTGVLWVNNLPLANGTNALTLTITNSAGFSSVTNISLVQSPLVLTMDPVKDDLWLPFVTVSGQVGHDTCAVWVNGVKATVTPNGDGTASWMAHKVPVPSGGVASFAVAAFEPDEKQPDGSYGNVTIADKKRAGFTVNPNAVTVPKMPQPERPR